MGVSCINTGTVPSKTLRETALYFSGLRQRGLYGIDYSLKENLTIAELMYRQQAVVENERIIVTNNLQRHRIDVIHGAARLVDDHTVRVKTDQREQDLTGDFILIATGSSPYHPPGIPFESQVFDSDS